MWSKALAKQNMPLKGHPMTSEGTSIDTARHNDCK